MQLLTIFAIPKPFEGHNGIIQRNAIESWRRLVPPCEIILCADDPGTAEAAREFRVKHLPNIARNEFGTPLLDSAFEQVRIEASDRLLCYVNADIILLDDLMESLGRIRFERFVMVGRRWDIDLAEPWDFDDPDWQQRIRRYVMDNGTLNSPAAIDYFVFPRDGGFGNLPPFAVGRPGWDNWFIYQARKLGFRIVDTTKTITAVHQNHGYAHVPNRSGIKSRGPEGDRNLELAGGADHVFTLSDATHIMTSRAVMPAVGWSHLVRRLERGPLIGPALSRLERVVNSGRKPLKFLTRQLSSWRGSPFRP